MKNRLFLLLSFTVLLCAEGAQAQRRQRPVAPVNSTATRAVADATGQRAAQTLPIRRVILYSNGVAYIERRGKVTGRAEIQLSFKQSQVDDVLKSMVVLDLGEGRVGAVSYNSSAPPSARMADIPFSISAETRGGATGGLAGVLAQLQGARVVVTTAQRTATGSVLTVEERKTQPATDKPSVTTHALVIVAEGGELMSFDLSDVRAVKLVDEGARRDINEFAGASASARRRDAKTITVTSDGAGAREMLVSYTVAAPIWKTTYRVVLDAEGKPFFQGWAIVDNVSDEDWDDVRLSLISGTPVSFIQPIQKPLYRYRPVVPIPSDLKVSPQVYEPDTGEIAASNSLTGMVTDPNGAVIPNASVTITNNANSQRFTANTNDSGVFIASLSPGNYTVTVDSAGFNRTVVSEVRVSPFRPAHINVSLNVGGVQETVTVTSDSVSGARPNSVNNLLLAGQDNMARFAPSITASSISDAIASEQVGVETAAEGSEKNDFFQYDIAQPVTVKRDRSALIPILQTRMEGARVSIFNESARRSRPMSGMLLKNSSSLTLEDGSLTVIDGNAYAGEALLERLKPGEQRLVSFALDLGTLVTARTVEDNAPAHFVKIVNGVLQAHYHEREKKVYTLTNQTDRPRIVYVEHPVRAGWELDDKETRKPEGKSARYYRFRVELAARATEQLNVVEREASVETFALTNLSTEQLSLFVTRRYLDPKTRDALQNIIELKGRLALAGARVSAIEREIAEIVQDQKRLRDNIEALAKTAEAKQLIARYVSKADQQESRLEQLAGEKQSAVDERRRLQSQLDTAIRTLSLDRAPDGGVAELAP